MILGCVNYTGKARQKWYARAVTKLTKSGAHLLAEPCNPLYYSNNPSDELNTWYSCSLGRLPQFRFGCFFPAPIPLALASLPKLLFPPSNHSLVREKIAFPIVTAPAAAASLQAPLSFLELPDICWERRNLSSPLFIFVLSLYILFNSSSLSALGKS